MTIEELKKLDRHIREIQYPFGDNYPLFRSFFNEVAKKSNLSVTEVIMQYVGWKYNKK